MATPDGERGIAQCARRLTAAIAEPQSTNVEDLVERLKPLHDVHQANWDAYRAAKEKAGEGSKLPEPEYPDGMYDLMKAYSARYGELYGALLESLGKPVMAGEHRTDDNAHLWRMIRRDR